MWKKILPLVLILLALVGFAFYFWEKEHETDHLTLYGNVDVRQVDISFRVGGKVKELSCEEGDFVQPGKLLALLDQEPYADRVKEAEANLEALRISEQNAKRTLERRIELIGDGSVSQEDLENAFSSYEVFSANLKQAEASLSIAVANLAYTEVYAPTTGTILTRIREPGTVVKEGDPVYTLSIADPVWVRAFIAEPYLGIVYPGMEAEIFTDTKGGPTYKGQVGFISPVAEFTPKTVETTQLRTDLVYRLRIYANDPDRGLRQGMPVTVKLKEADPSRKE